MSDEDGDYDDASSVVGGIYVFVLYTYMVNA